MKHEVEEKTRKVCRGIITTIRTRHGLSRKDAEEYFQRAVSDSDVIDALIAEVDRDLAEQKEDELQLEYTRK